jgi:23S rRNA (pseudouridine1915-N3)-methyltransferase
MTKTRYLVEKFPIMQIALISIGKDRREEFSPAIERYRKQLPWQLELIEKTPKKPNAPVLQRMEEEASLMQQAGQGAAVHIALDEHGKVMTSQAFAEQIGNWQAQGRSKLAFYIGGADGLHPQLLQRCEMKLAFGAMTWPHQMVRLLLVEQLYRAHTILSGHPYHRG